MMSYTQELLWGRGGGVRVGGGVVQTRMLGNDDGEQRANPVGFGGTDVGFLVN